MKGVPPGTATRELERLRRVRLASMKVRPVRDGDRLTNQRDDEFTATPQ
jgi:hypothetical protein